MTTNQNSYQLFAQPSKFFQDIFKEIRQAKKEIIIETYRIDEEGIGEKLLDLLIKKAKSIPVTLIVDSYKFYPEKEMAQKLNQSNINLHIFHPMSKQLFNFRIRRTLSWIHLRTHRKLSIIDDKAYVGGINYMSAEIGWRDIMFKITGPVIKELKKVHEELKGIAKKQVYEIRKINKSLTKEFRNKDTVIRNIPLSKHLPYLKQIRRLIKQAKKEIIIVTPYFIPDPTISLALHHAKKRGVKISILIPNKGDNYGADILSKMHAYVALQEKIPVYQYPVMMHAKYMVIDNVATFGSFNFDYRSFFHNYELNIITKHNDVVDRLKNLALADMELSVPFTINQWKKRGLRKKFIEKVLWPVKKYF